MGRRFRGRVASPDSCGFCFGGTGPWRERCELQLISLAGNCWPTREHRQDEIFAAAVNQSGRRGTPLHREPLARQFQVRFSQQDASDDRLWPIGPQIQWVSLWPGFVIDGCRLLERGGG